MARFKLKSGETLETFGARLFDLGRRFKEAGEDVQKAFVQREGPSADSESHDGYAQITEAQGEIIGAIDPSSSKIHDIPLEVRFVFDHLQEKDDSNGETVRVVYVAVPDFNDYDDGNKLIGNEKLTGVAREAMGFVSIMGCTN